jgi:predicted  nucleic acid-binding Zn-ribbon protein
MTEQTLIDTTMETLAQRRDELRVKLNLAKAEVRDEWHELEQKWNRIEAEARRAGVLGAEATAEMRQVVAELAKDLREGYDRLRRTL